MLLLQANCSQCDMFFPLLSVISCEEGKALADSWNAAFMESSAKENQVMMMMMMTPATPRLIYSLANSVLTSSIAVGAILAQNVPRQLQSSLNLNWKSNLKEHLVPTWPGRIIQQNCCYFPIVPRGMLDPLVNATVLMISK